MLIYKLAKEAANYLNIVSILIVRGYADLHPDHIGKIVRRMRDLFDKPSEPQTINAGDSEHNLIVEVPEKQIDVDSEIK